MCTGGNVMVKNSEETSTYMSVHREGEVVNG